MKLSYRDKVIFVAAIVIVILVAGIFLFIKPKFESMNYAKLALDAKKSEESDVKAKIDTLPDIIASLKTTAQDVGEVQEYFLETQDPYLNEQYVREILGNNVTTLSMNTQYTEADDLEEYVVNPANVVSYDLRMNSDLYNELPQEVYDNYNKVGKREGSSIVIGVTTMSVGYRDKVDYSGIYKFIDAVKDAGKTVIVTEFARGEDEQNATQLESSINLKLYSISYLNVDKVMEESDEFVLDTSLVNEEAE